MSWKDRKKVLFIDRDGVIVREQQVDSYDRIEYIPYVFRALGEIVSRTDYLLVMVSNPPMMDLPGLRRGYSAPSAVRASSLTRS